VISALSYALDLTEGQPMGHAVRCCIIGMRVAQEMGLPVAQQSDLYYALLMKDAGCSANASKMVQILGTDDLAGKRDAMRMDWTKVGWESLQYALGHVKTGAPFLERVRGLYDMASHQKENAKLLNQIRCERGSAIARRIGLSAGAAEAIHNVNEHWNGLGQPRGIRGRDIPLLSRIMNLAQTVDIFFSHYGGAAGPARSIEVIDKRSGRWFDPDVANAFFSIAILPSFWADVEDAARRVNDFEPRQDRMLATPEAIDNICLAFADVIDAKSPFTYRHSTGVAGAAVAMAKTLGLSDTDVTMMRRAALLHDIGKLGVSNAILDKPGKLTDDEWASVKKHPFYTHEILRRIPGFGELSEIAASHHEKLDGSGYFRHLDAEHMPLAARILVVADIYDALAARRPYRDAMPIEAVFNIIAKDAPKALDIECFEALKCSCDEATSITADLLQLSASVQETTSSCTLPVSS
jgi:putative nucleotidyltransferase with HDIG domain